MSRTESALERLLAGNSRFVEVDTEPLDITVERRNKLVSGQAPFAAVLTCADSRTPPEHIFGAGLGELFVCRNAGNIVDSVVVGSFEYAVAHTGCPLICILGHDHCGAMAAAVKAFNDPSWHETAAVDHIVRHLLPSVALAGGDQVDAGSLQDAAARLNVLEGRRRLLESPLLKSKVDSGELKIICAWYNLGSGKVELLD